MRALGGLLLALAFTGGLSAQYRGAISARGSGGSRFGSPGTGMHGTRYGISSNSMYAFPIYVPMYDPSLYGAQYGAPGTDGGPAPMQAAPNVIVIYPPQGAPMAGPETAHPSMQIYQPMQPDTPQTGQAAQEETADHYLFAFKDHSIYSAVAYWVDGDTLHYFTNGSTHNQASLSLLDRDLTMRLNKESGAELKLPPVK